MPILIPGEGSKKEAKPKETLQILSLRGEREKQNSRQQDPLEIPSIANLSGLPEDMQSEWIQGRLKNDPIAFFNDLVIATGFQTNPFAELIERAKANESYLNPKPSEEPLRVIQLNEITQDEAKKLIQVLFDNRDIHAMHVASLESAKKVEGLKEQIEPNLGLDRFLEKIIEISKSIQDLDSFNIFNQHLEFALMTYLHQTGYYQIRNPDFVTDYFRANYSKDGQSKIWTGTLNPFCECISLFQVPDFIGSKIADLAGQDKSNWHPLVWLSKLNRGELEELSLPNIGLDMEGEWLDRDLQVVPKGFSIGHDAGSNSIHEIRRDVSAISTELSNLADFYDLWYWVKRSGFIGGSIHFHFDTVPNQQDAISNIARSMKYPVGIQSENRLTSDVWEFRLALPGRKKSKYDPNVPFNSKDLNLFPIIDAFNEIAKGKKRSKTGISWFDLQILEEPVEIISIFDAIPYLQAAWIYRKEFQIADLAALGVKKLTHLSEAAQEAFIYREKFVPSDLAKVGISNFNQLSESAKAAFIYRNGFVPTDLAKVGVTDLTKLSINTQAAFVERNSFVPEDLAAIGVHDITRLNPYVQVAFIERKGFVPADLAKVGVTDLTKLSPYAQGAFINRNSFLLSDLTTLGVNNLTQLSEHAQATFISRNSFVLEDLKKVGIHNLITLHPLAQAAFIYRDSFVLADLKKVGIHDLLTSHPHAQAAFMYRDNFVLADLANVGITDFTKLAPSAQAAFMHRKNFVPEDLQKVGIPNLTNLSENAQRVFISRNGFVPADLAKVGVSDLTKLSPYIQIAFIGRKDFIPADLAKVGVTDFTKLYREIQAAFIARENFVPRDLAIVGVSDLTELSPYAQAAFISREKFTPGELKFVGINNLSQLSEYAQGTFIERTRFVPADLAEVGVTNLTTLSPYAQVVFINRYSFVPADLAIVGITNLAQLSPDAQVAFINRYSFVPADLAEVDENDINQ